VLRDSTKTLIPAATVKTGDLLVTSKQADPTEVLSIRKVQRRGVYAPLTLTGDIIVSGVAASNFVALPGTFQKYMSFDSQHWLQHVAFMPYRFYCAAFGCEEETYDEKTGLSKAAMFWMPILKVMESFSFAIPLFAYIVILPAQWAVFNLAHLTAAMFGYFAWKKAQKRAIDNSVTKKIAKSTGGGELLTEALVN